MGKVAYIKTAQFEILDHRSIELCAAPFLQSVTWTYDVELSAQGSSPHIQSKKVDQSIPANGTDRFQFRISSADPGISNFYRLKINLIYNNGDDNRVSSEPLILEIPQAIEIMAMTHFGDEGELKCVRSNIENALYMISLSGVKSEKIAKLQKDELKKI